MFGGASSTRGSPCLRVHGIICRISRGKNTRWRLFHSRYVETLTLFLCRGGGFLQEDRGRNGPHLDNSLGMLWIGCCNVICGCLCQPPPTPYTPCWGEQWLSFWRPNLSTCLEFVIHTSGIWACNCRGISSYISDLFTSGAVGGSATYGDARKKLLPDLTLEQTKVPSLLSCSYCLSMSCMMEDDLERYMWSRPPCMACHDFFLSLSSWLLSPNLLAFHFPQDRARPCSTGGGGGSSSERPALLCSSVVVPGLAFRLRQTRVHKLMLCSSEAGAATLNSTEIFIWKCIKQRATDVLPPKGEGNERLGWGWGWGGQGGVKGCVGGWVSGSRVKQRGEGGESDTKRSSLN